jgi:hypothetical protein
MAYTRLGITLILIEGIWHIIGADGRVLWRSVDEKAARTEFARLTKARDWTYTSTR